MLSEGFANDVQMVVAGGAVRGVGRAWELDWPANDFR